MVIDDRYAHLRFRNDSPSKRVVAELLNELFQYAFNEGVSDIHFKINDVSDSMQDRDSYIELRKNGVISHYKTIAPSEGLIIKDLICSKAKIAQSDNNQPHDGRMKLYYGRNMDARVSIVPLTDRAFSIVCRILDSDNSRLSIDGFNVDDMKKYVLKQCVKKTEGMILVSGPTGSGKTTTLYTLLNYAHTGENIVITIEDPVEYFVPAYRQIEVTSVLPFAKALTHVLRQDPDVIMLGEIRDNASADTAIKAAETGHLLMSTIHSIDALSSINRLEGMGVSRQQISGVLTAVLAQRLVKKIDADADISWVDPSDVEVVWLKRNGIYFEGIKFPKVPPTKMSSRMPLMELIEITSEIREVIAQPGDRTAQLLELVSKQPQFETLAECGVKLALAGQTTLAEVMHVTRDNQLLSVTKRFEQIMIERGWLTVPRLDEAWRILIEHKDLGMVYSLERILIDNEFASERDVMTAVELANNTKPESISTGLDVKPLAARATTNEYSSGFNRMQLPPDRAHEALVA